MSKKNIQAVYPLSPMQQGMLFHSLYSPQTGVYHEQLSCTLRGDLDVAAFEQAWQYVVARHPVLRTSFVWKRLDKPLQVVHREVDLTIARHDWRHLSITEQEMQLESHLQADRARNFNLVQPPLIRLALMQTGEDSHRFVWSHHHLLLDGWSLPLLLQEVFAAYEAFCRQEMPNLPPVRPYQDYITWLQQQASDPSQAETFWREMLQGLSAPTPLGIDRHASGPTQYNEEAIRLSKATTSALQSLAQQHRLTLNTLLQGVWAILLSRYSGEEDVLFGATVSGRPAELAGVETMMGLFINTLPVRVLVQSELPVLDWLKKFQAQQVELRQYEHISLVDIQGWSEIPRQAPLFESIFVFENYPVDDSLREAQGLGDLQIEDIRDFDQTNYPLTISSGPEPQMVLKMSYDQSRFEPGVIGRVLGHFQKLLEGIIAAPDQFISDLPLLTEAEQKQILLDWNATTLEEPTRQHRAIHQLFEAQVERNSNAVAVIDKHQQLTYTQLNHRANQLAHHLIALGVGPETRVGICLDRSVDLLVALLGVLKAGGAYLPLDPTYPPERLAFMFQDAQLALLLTQEDLRLSLPVADLSLVCLDTDWPAISQLSATNPNLPTRPNHLVYMIYTSGSTGQSKGVLIEHHSLVNAFLAWEKAYDLPNLRCHLQMANFAFDVFSGDWVRALCSGSQLVLCPREWLLAPDKLYGLIQQHQVEAAEFVPAVLRHLIQYLAQAQAKLPSLKLLACGSDNWYVGEYKQFLAFCGPDTRLINSFGLTEATIDSSFFESIDLTLSSDQVVPIGRPFANMRLYILDPQLQPTPIGVPGELFVGGQGVARGYHQRPDLTADKFIPDPFSSQPGDRLYKTGDRARYLADGAIEFLGRLDHQLKIRGFRIEPGEIEAALKQHPAVLQTAVLAQPASDGEQRLVAYLVLDPATTPLPTTGDLRRFLQERLPDYMVPAAFMMLDKLPLTPNGKIDRRALPQPDWSRRDVDNAYVAPRTPSETLLVGIWQQVLGLAQLGIHDNFFDLGGHSLLATQLVSRIQTAFDIDLPLRRVFEAPTVADLAEFVEVAQRTEVGLQVPPITPVSRDQTLPLSFSQQRLWFIDQLEPGNLLFNLPLVFQLSGQLDITALKQCLNEVVRRHSVLRTTFQTRDGQPYQIIKSSLFFDLPLEDISSLPEAERESTAEQLIFNEVQRPFDLAEGPLLRGRLLRIEDNEHIVILTIHHIIADGWSVNLFTEEMVVLYQAIIADEASPLPELPVQYADFAHWQRQWLQGEVLEQQLSYWQQQLADLPPLLELPTDRPRPAVQSHHGSHYFFALEPNLYHQLVDVSRREGVTLFMTLLGAFQILLCRYTGQEDISVGTPIANRTRPEIERLIGFFVNNLVMRTDLSGDPTVSQLLKQVRQVALGAYAHQDLPFEMLVEALQPQRDLSHSPLFQVMFVLDNTPATAIELAGLTLTPIEDERGSAQFDLTLALTEAHGELNGYVQYNTDLFDASTIERLVGHFQTLLESIVADVKQPLSKLTLLTQAEQQQLLVDWSQTTVPFPSDHCIHHLVAQQAQAQPEAIALTFEGRSLTYAELDCRANQLGHHLQKLGVGPKSLVGLSTERSLEMVIGILGILKAGGAYLPLDPSYPPERLAFMLEDAQVPLVLTQARLVERLPLGNATVIRLDQDWSHIEQESEQPPSSSVTADNLAYVIYTSGSTGKPKGAMLRHRGLCNLTDVQRRAFNIRPESKILQFSPLSFDASVWEMFMALRNGATLVLAPQETLASGADLLRLLQREQVTNVTLPPSVLAVLSPDDLPHLETIIAAGEACSAELVSRWAPGRAFFNAYGPTETTVCASMYRCDEYDPQSPPIGRPIDNTQLYILDPNLQPTPIGVPGELHIGGVSLARGYLNRPDLTAEKFIHHPFSEDPQARLYKTGDLARYRPDGNIEFLGRIDHQVKVRGFRIELGEIETALKQHPALQDSIVIVREDTPGDKRLVAYVVPREAPGPVGPELREYLGRSLPDYMTPSLFMTLEALPLLPNGKINRRALPAPDRSRPDMTESYVAPRNDTERQLAALAADLLGVEQIGVYDSFFELGGHSLLATQFISRIRDSFGVDLPLRHLFENPTIAGLSQQLDQAQAANQATQSVTDMLKLLDQLSEDEAQALLHEKQTLLKEAKIHD